MQINLNNRVANRDVSNWNTFIFNCSADGLHDKDSTKEQALTQLQPVSNGTDSPLTADA